MQSKTKRPANRGRFQRGFDSRRHTFSRDECVKGFWAAIESIVRRWPEAIRSDGRHMACDFLNAAGRLTIKGETQDEK